MFWFGLFRTVDRVSLGPQILFFLVQWFQCRYSSIMNWLIDCNSKSWLYKLSACLHKETLALWSPRNSSLFRQPNTVCVVPNFFLFFSFLNNRDRNHFDNFLLCKTILHTSPYLCPEANRSQRSEDMPTNSLFSFFFKGCCQLWDLVFNPNHVQSIEFATRWFCSSCRSILRIIGEIWWTSAKLWVRLQKRGECLCTWYVWMLIFFTTS